MKKLVILAVVVMAGMGAGLGVADKLWGDRPGEQEIIKAAEMSDPEISGWVAWWKEEPAYDLAATRSGEIGSISPVWWLVDENLSLKKVGKMNRSAIVSRMKSAGVKVYPTLGSELSGKKLSPLFEKGGKSDEVISALVFEASESGADGIDIDLEGIDTSDRENFVNFLVRLRSVMQGFDLKLSVTIQAQDGKNFWFGAAGQDIARIGETADEVRIMAYDRHSKSSDPGAIAPLDWIEDVAKYNLGLIEREKIVMGIPSYGYIWPKTGPASGLQWDEFWQRISEKEYFAQRDKLSGEVRITGQDFSAWLSDGEAMRTKISLFRNMGINRFVIWHLGGMDVGFFGTPRKTS